MDEEITLIIVLVAVVGFFIGAVVFVAINEANLRAEAPNITIQELTSNKTAYIDKYVKLSGTLTENIDTETRTWYMTILIPIVHSTGKTTYTTFIPMLIPMREKYNVYTFTDGNYTVAISHEGSLDKYLGQQLTISGKVDGVKNSNGQIFDYILVAEKVT